MGWEAGLWYEKLKPMGVIIFKCRFYLVADIGEDTPANDKKDYGSKEGGTSAGRDRSPAFSRLTRYRSVSLWRKGLSFRGKGIEGRWRKSDE